MAKPDEVARVGVYMEPALKIAAEKLAKRQRRSLSAFMCVLLEKAVAEAEARGELEANVLVGVQSRQGGAGDGGS